VRSRLDGCNRVETIRRDHCSRRTPDNVDPRLVDKQYHLRYQEEKKYVDFGSRQNNDGTMTTASTPNQV